MTPCALASRRNVIRGRSPDAVGVLESFQVVGAAVLTSRNPPGCIPPPRAALQCSYLRSSLAVIFVSVGRLRRDGQSLCQVAVRIADRFHLVPRAIQREHLRLWIRLCPGLWLWCAASSAASAASAAGPSRPGRPRGLGVSLTCSGLAVQLLQEALWCTGSAGGGGSTRCARGGGGLLGLGLGRGAALLMKDGPAR